jgi:hypothetical protein
MIQLFRGLNGYVKSAREAFDEIKLLPEPDPLPCRARVLDVSMTIGNERASHQSVALVATDGTVAYVVDPVLVGLNALPSSQPKSKWVEYLFGNYGTNDNGKKGTTTGKACDPGGQRFTCDTADWDHWTWCVGLPYYYSHECTIDGSCGVDLSWTNTGIVSGSATASASANAMPDHCAYLHKGDVYGPSNVIQKTGAKTNGCFSYYAGYKAAITKNDVSIKVSVSGEVPGVAAGSVSFEYTSPAGELVSKTSMRTGLACDCMPTPTPTPTPTPAPTTSPTPTPTPTPTPAPTTSPSPTPSPSTSPSPSPSSTPSGSTTM